MTEPLDEPLAVIARNELAADPARVAEILVAMEIQALLLERAHEALDDAVALRFPTYERCPVLGSTKSTTPSPRRTGADEPRTPAHTRKATGRR